jgi:hypothetical protein
MRYSVTGTAFRAGATAVSFVISQISAGAPSDGRAERYPRRDESYTTWWLIEIARRRGREYVRKSKPADVQWADLPEGRSLDETEDDDESRSGSAVRRAEGTPDRATPRRRQRHDTSWARRHTRMDSKARQPRTGGSTMTAQPADQIPASGPDTGSYEVIHLGGQAAVLVPVSDFLRLQALEQAASAQELEDAEDKAGPRLVSG